MYSKKSFRLTIIVFSAIFLLIYFNVLFVTITGVHLVSGADINQYAANRDFRKNDYPSRRGTIYDRNGNVIAKDIETYNVYIVLSTDRMDGKKPAHMTDANLYAKKISPILDADEEVILDLLSQDGKKVYQTELGLSGTNISVTQKEELEALNLPGIEFTPAVSRFYPNGVFASETVGYSVFNPEENRMVGMLGVEERYDDQLKGDSGYQKILVDSSGYKRLVIEEKESVPGNDVYLTIDNNIQRLLESNMDQLMQSNPAELAIGVVLDAKTGEVLAVSNRPSFNPNKLDIVNFTNPFVSNVFEPGSTMKTFTYASAMDSGYYNGDALFDSNSVAVMEGNEVVQVINNYGLMSWGKISYDEGFMKSSNTGIVRLLQTQFTPEIFGDYLDKFQFYKNTGIDISGEQKGTKVFDRKQEQYTTGFGQASTTTPVQLVQAFTAITNNGKMMQPYITDKIVNSSNEILLENKPIVKGNPIDKDASLQMLALMRKAIEDERAIAQDFQNDLYSIAGKTGTAEIVGPDGKYLTCPTCTYNSILVGAPANDPEIIIYIVTKNEKELNSEPRQELIRNMTTNVLAYLNVKPDRKVTLDNKKSEIIKIESFINNSLDYSLKKLDNNKVDTFVIGDGDIVINQNPLPFQEISTSQKVFLLTDSKTYDMIDLTSFSKNEVLRFASLLNLEVEFQGTGYVKSQNIEVGVKLTDKSVLNVKLE